MLSIINDFSTGPHSPFEIEYAYIVALEISVNINRGECGILAKSLFIFQLYW